MDFNGIIIRLVGNNDARQFLKDREDYLNIVGDDALSVEEWKDADRIYKSVIIRFAGGLFAKLCEWRIKADG